VATGIFYGKAIHAYQIDEMKDLQVVHFVFAIQVNYIFDNLVIINRQYIYFDKYNFLFTRVRTQGL